ncbi:MAG: efflux RND transporter permease subunit [Acidobacteriota bacterium]
MNITKFAIQRPVTVSMFVVAVILFGAISLDRLALNLLPDISYPSLTIQTDFEDAAPEEVESLVTRPIEEVVGVVGGMTRLSSISRPGESQVVLEFAWDTNMDFASMDVREKLDLIELPRDVEKPVILRFDPSYDPIMRLQLYGDLSLTRLRYVADKEVKKSLESTEGVAAVKVVGGREEQIRIEIDEKRLADLGISITEVTWVIDQSNLNRASGSLYDLDANYLVRMLNEFQSVEEIQRIIIRDQDGRKVVLGDVAQVWRGVRDRDIIARFNGKESVELAIYKEGDANTVTVSEAVRARLKGLTDSKTFPQGVQYAVVSDQAEFINEAVDNVLSAAVVGGLLATIVLFLFLRDLRSTIIIGLSIPVSIMATFALMYQTDISLNIMSLGGVALGVGMLVDNSIVVLEAVHRHRKAGSDPAQAVYRGATEVGRAITASTLTTVAVFVPLVFVEGVAGQLFKDQALAITYSLLASLLVALTIVPMALAMRIRPPVENRAESSPAAPRELSQNKVFRLLQQASRSSTRATRAVGRFVFVDLVQVILNDLRRLTAAIGRGILKAISPGLNCFSSGFEKLQNGYVRLLRWSLASKAEVFAITLSLLLLSAIAYRNLGAELIPSLAQGEFSFEIKLPEGTPIEHTDRLIRDLESNLTGLPEVETVYSSIGGSNENQFASSALQEHIGQIYVLMKDSRDKEAEQVAITELREALRRYPELTYTFSRPTLFSFKTPVEVEIYAYDIQDQRSAAEAVAARLAQIDGLTDIQTTTRLGAPEVQVRLDRERLARLGLDESQIATILRNKIRGEVASRFHEDDKQIDILVRAGESDRSTISDLQNLVINQQDLNNRGRQQNAGTENRRSGEDDSSRSETLAGSVQAQELQNNSGNQNQSQNLNRGIPILLGAVADISVARGPTEVRRIRSQRAALVSANLTGRDLSSVSSDIRAELQELRAQLPVNSVVALGGQNEELERAYWSLLFALGLAIFLVYLVMASQFESLIHPFIIMFSVPLAMIGVLLSLFLTGTEISVLVFLGVIILAGIVVNNAIVLIDYTNQLREQGFSRREALIEAGQVRLRPIVMTTLTTLLGLFPMALGWGEGAEVRSPMAITVMGGLAFSTLLTLVFIPIVYELIDRKVYVAADSKSPVAGIQSEPALRPGGAANESA